MTVNVQTEERGQLLAFLNSLKANKGAEGLRPHIRVVSKGLFVDERGISALVELYHLWLERESQGIARKPLDKCFQWLFQEREPLRYYLVEGKNTLIGSIIPIPISNPQQFGLPYYLGSLLSASDYLHPADPILNKIPKLEVARGKGGAEWIVLTRGSKIVVTEKLARDFSLLIKSSRFVERRYPDAMKTLAGALQLLVTLVRRSRPVPRSFPLIVPFDVKSSKSKGVRMAGKFMFIEERGALVRILELNGRNLSGFLRSELVRAPREKLGSFKLTPKHRDLMGFYESFGKRRSVHARAFAEFEEAIRRTRDARERFQGFFSSAECFEKFSSLYQMSTPIEAHKIRSTIERYGVSGHSYTACGGWIFVLDRGQVLVRVIARHIRLTGHRRGAS